MDHDRAEVVAYCAQYVDDATNDGLVLFDNGAAYWRLATAHKALDYRNFAELAKRLIWVPFHFLPGNGGLPAGESPEGKFIEKLVTRPNSPPARDMMRAVVLERGKRYGLHRLGVAAHTFVDTWAHQGFVGVSHRRNDVRNVEQNGEPDRHFVAKLTRFFNGVLHQSVPPIGHANALSYPDRPYLRWCYFDGSGARIVRDNPGDFVQAADQLCRWVRRFLAGDTGGDPPGLPPKISARIKTMFETLTDDNPDRRHERWLAALAEDAFGFGPVELTYRPKGADSWKHRALGTTASRDSKSVRFEYRAEFLRSDWKLFHDASKAHRLSVVDDILPEYGISVA